MARKKKTGSKSSSNSTSSTISTSAVQAIIAKLKRDRVCESTKRNYYSVWKTFNEFFVRLDHKPNNWEDQLVLFVGHLVSENKNSQTIRSYISAIKNVLADDGVILNENKF